MAKLGELAIEIFVDGVEAFLELLLGKFANGVVRGVVIDVGK
jgi:hypothetical protein